MENKEQIKPPEQEKRKRVKKGPDLPNAVDVAEVVNRDRVSPQFLKTLAELYKK